MDTPDTTDTLDMFLAYDPVTINMADEHRPFNRAFYEKEAADAYAAKMAESGITLKVVRIEIEPDQEK